MMHSSAPASTVIWLGEKSGADPLVVGPKAAHLSLLAGQFRVPPGFCLSADTYRRAGIPARVSPGLRNTITGAYSRLADICGVSAPRVAVRSSAVDEDGPLASFAGQHETLLNIVGVDALVDAIEHSWMSAHTEQALSYRSRHGLAIDGIGLAVLVQHLVVADVAGVMFSANPVNGRRNELVVSASWGLGESIVGGTVTPDSWIVSRQGLQILDEQIGDKRMMTVAVGGGTQEVEVPRVMRDRPSLSVAQIQEVALLGTRLEEVKGWPVDIEFAISAGTLYLLQCRPITTLGQEMLTLNQTI